MTYLITTRACTMYDKYQSMDELLVSSAIVWRKDKKLARQQAVSMELSAGTIMGNLNMVKRAVKAGADEKITDMYGNHPLSRAAYHGHEAIVRYLIEQGADVNGRGLRPPPLFQAAENGHYSAFKLLLDHGAKVKFKDPGTKRTLIHAAAKGGDVHIVKELLSERLKADRRDQDNLTPIIFTAMSGNEEVAQVLVENKVDVNRESHLANELVANWSPIHFAAYMGDSEILKVLLAAGANAELKDYRQNTPGQIADQSLKFAK